ncbi:unnamed protein product [Caenorhabditis auriculariae]|uniref:Uncharacterized protein n=1 Tax=Caenorhabditis auriculariae TaxID=2777116 RepID=A0A8S1HDS7_9PELO|nr:unnamed protein product [Caenorhabditis auriculariae]
MKGSSGNEKLSGKGKATPTPVGRLTKYSGKLLKYNAALLPSTSGGCMRQVTSFSVHFTRFDSIHHVCSASKLARLLMDGVILYYPPMKTLLVGFVLILSVSALRFYVPAKEKKCLKEEIHKNVVVSGEYEFSEGIGYTGSVHVTDTRGHTLYKRERFQDLKGKFAFTADEYDIFEICISNDPPAGQLGEKREVSLIMKHGVEAKNYEDVAKAEKLKPLEVELRRLEDLADAIEMRTTNESTNNRVLYLSIFSMLCLLGLAAWQLFSRRRCGDMRGNPLECVVCNKELFEPVLLGCQHTVCQRCSAAGCTTCAEVLRSPSTSRSQTPVPDRLAAFLLDVSKEHADSCANCDEVSQPMFFCETCQQTLCLSCRNSTHQARMFATHKIITADERNRVYGSSLCKDHGEPYILYCSDVRKLVCIQCFNGRPLEERHSFVSIESGHKSTIEKIENWASKLRLFQSEKEEELEVRERMISENSTSHEEAKNSIYQLCQQINDTVLTTRDRLVRELEVRRELLNNACRVQIAEIESVLDPVRLCLLISQILCTSASKVDVLQFTTELYRRIHVLLDRSVEKLPVAASADTFEVRTELAKALEPFLGLSAAWCPLSAARDASREGSASYKRTSGSQSKVTLSKFQAAIDLSGAFGQLFSRVDHPLRQLVIDLSLTSQKVLEIQKDLTRRRCLISEEVVQDLIKSTRKIETDLGLHSAALDDMQSEMQELWQEQLDRVRRQQIIYREKIQEVLMLRETARQVLTAAKQLAPYVSCILQMNAVIDPKRCHPPDPAPMESICLQITEIEPNSENRILAIEKEEQNRKANQEAKRKDALIGIDAVVKTLKHGKARRKESHRLLVNTARERSPGGTDTALKSPCLKRISPTVREETNSELDIEEFWDESFDLSGEQMENVDSAFIDQARCSSSFTFSLGSSPTSSLPSLDQLLGKIPLASRVTPDIGSCRMSMLQSLNDVFAIQKPGDESEEKFVLEERNVLASAVKNAEKRRRGGETEESIHSQECLAKQPEETKIKKAVVRHRVKRKDVDRKDLAEDAELGVGEVVPMIVEGALPPPAPFVPPSVFESVEGEKLRSFEAKEKLLQSLKEKLRTRIGRSCAGMQTKTPLGSSSLLLRSTRSRSNETDGLLNGEMAVFFVNGRARIPQSSGACFKHCAISNCTAAAFYGEYCFAVDMENYFGQIDEANLIKRHCVANISQPLLAKEFDDRILVDYTQKVTRAADKRDCLTQCQKEQEFPCLSTMFYEESGDCLLNSANSKTGVVKTDTGGFKVSFVEFQELDANETCSNAFQLLSSDKVEVRGDTKLFNGSGGLAECIARCKRCDFVIYNEIFMECFLVEQDASGQLLDFVNDEYKVLSSLCTTVAPPCTARNSLYVLHGSSEDSTKKACLGQCVDDISCRFAHLGLNGKCEISSRRLRSELVVERHCIGFDDLPDGSGVLFDEVGACTNSMDNLARMEEVELQECMHLCVTHPTRSCEWIEYSTNRLCILHDSSVRTGNSSSCTVYTLNVIKFSNKKSPEKAPKKAKLFAADTKKKLKIEEEKLQNIIKHEGVIDDSNVKISTICNMGDVTIKVSVETERPGELFVRNSRSNCSAVIGRNGTAELKIHHNDTNCLLMKEGSIMHTVVVVKKNEFSNSSVITADDRMFQIRCDYSNHSSSVAVAKTIDLRPPEFMEMAMKGAVHISPIKMELRSKREAFDAKPVTIGQSLDLVFRAEDSLLENFFVQRCVALSSDEREQIVLVDEGCATTNAKEFILRGELRQDAMGFVLPFRAFRFKEGEGVKITCTLDKCQKCKRKICSKHQQRTRRYKEFEEGVGSAEEVHAELLVRVPEDDNYCLTSSCFAVVAAIVAAVISVQLLLLFYFFYNRRSR